MDKIIAHRGVFDNKDVVENTMQAFDLAIRKRIPFELDIQLTKDNQIVVYHDFNLARLSNSNKIIQESTYNELKEIKLLNTDSTIPLFKDILELNNDKVLIDIEIKKTKRIQETVDLLVELLKPYTNYMIKSFDPRIVKYVNKNYSWIKVGLLIENKYDNFLEEKLLKSKFIINYCKPDFVAISKKLLDNQKFMNKIKDIPILIWTIKDDKEIKYDSDYTYICNNLMNKKKKM